ncbi:hypothetical protein ACIPD2_16620 [Streptomyces griseofuscus]|uniref:hypothetical protein n=1 Tax=Streptomyces griseofuscus TaxID=146922 RepID=UPI00340F8503
MTTEPLAVGTVTALVADAVAAPSLGNAQPWAFRYLRDAGVLWLYADPERAFACRPREPGSAPGLRLRGGTAESAGVRRRGGARPGRPAAARPGAP